MRVTAGVVVVLVGGFGCFSTARYDDAHVQRVAIINARYEAACRRQAEQYASLAAVAQLLSRVGECGAGAWAPGRGSSSHSGQPSKGGGSPARR